MKLRHLWIILGLTSASFLCQAAEESISIGVLAYRQKEDILQHWQPLVTYLEQRMEKYHIQLQVFDFKELNQKINRHELDFVLTNPAHYIELRENNSLSGALVTFVQRYDEQPITAFGGVIFCLTSRADINELRDIDGKKIAISDKKSLGGYQAQIAEIHQMEINLSRKTEFVTMGMPQDLAVEAVLSGQADVGFVRTGILESLADSHKINIGQLKILNRQELSSYPFAVSTHLYPEWPLVALPHVNSQLARRLVSQLLLIEPDSAIAKTGQFYGFSIPANYNSIEMLLREERLPPYDVLPTFTLIDIWKKFKYALCIALLGLIVAAFLLVRLSYLNGKLRKAQQHADNESYKLATILDNIAACVYIKDTAYRYQFANLATQQFLNLKSDEILHKTDNAFFKQDTARKIYENDKSVIESQKKCEIIEEIILITTGEKRSYLTIKAPLFDHDNHVYAICGISTDVTELKNIELELQRSNAELEQFAYAISHDMRQPLRMVRSYLQLLEKALSPHLNKDTKQFMAFALEGATRMDAMILSLLDYSRVGRNKDNKTLIDSYKCLKEAIAFLEPDIKIKNANLDILGNYPEVVVIKDELTRLFQNLIGNALKYHAPNSPPHVTVNAMKKNNVLRVEIRDQGIGIEKEHIGRLFKVFSRLQSYQEYEGAGVGLALCRKIIEHHHGAIGVESEGKNLGCCFWFEIPMI